MVGTHPATREGRAPSRPRVRRAVRPYFRPTFRNAPPFFAGVTRMISSSADAAPVRGAPSAWPSTASGASPDARPYWRYGTVPLTVTYTFAPSTRMPVISGVGAPAGTAVAPDATAAPVTAPADPNAPDATLTAAPGTAPAVTVEGVSDPRWQVRIGGHKLLLSYTKGAVVIFR